MIWVGFNLAKDTFALAANLWYVLLESIEVLAHDNQQYL